MLCRFDYFAAANITKLFALVGSLEAEVVCSLTIMHATFERLKFFFFPKRLLVKQCFAMHCLDDDLFVKWIRGGSSAIDETESLFSNAS